MLCAIINPKSEGEYMAYTSWNYDLINEQYKKISDIYKNTGDSTALIDKQVIEKIFESGPKVVCFDIAANPVLQINDNINALYDYIDYMQYIQQFSKLKLAKKDLPDLSVMGHTESNLLSFVHDFYNSMPAEIKSRFNKVFKDRKDNLQLSKERSSSLFLPYLKTAYINVQVQNTIEDFFNIVHEYAHVITDLICYKSGYYMGYPFIELFSLAMELIASDFLEDHFNVSNEIQLYKAYTWRSIKMWCEDLVMEAKFYRQENMTQYINEPAIGLARANNISIDEANKILTMSTMEKFIYAVPFITSVEFYYQYRQDPELFFKNLIEFICLPDNTNYISELKNRGIYLNAHSKAYVKELNNELKKVS